MGAIHPSFTINYNMDSNKEYCACPLPGLTVVIALRCPVFAVESKGRSIEGKREDSSTQSLYGSDLVHLRRLQSGIRGGLTVRKCSREGFTYDWGLCASFAFGLTICSQQAADFNKQYTFRQWEGINSINVWFEAGIPQTYAWTLLSPYIVSCPSHNEPLQWTIFPKLTIDNNPEAISAGLAAGGAAISHNISALTATGDELQFTYDQPGKTQGPYNQKTMAGPHTHGDKPRYAAFISQLNLTYSPLYDVTSTSAKVKVPGGNVLPVGGKGIINGTMFVSLTSQDPYLTPANLSLINSYTVAGPALFQAG